MCLQPGNGIMSCVRACIVLFKIRVVNIQTSATHRLYHVHDNNQITVLDDGYAITHLFFKPVWAENVLSKLDAQLFSVLEK